MSSCGNDLFVVGLVEGEVCITCVRILTTIISITVLSAWVNGEKIRRLSLFFAHWLAGFVAGLGYLVEDAMVTVCWTGSNLVGFIKFLKWIELTAFNMFALTNLTICVNLALIVSSHRTMSRVQSVSSPTVLVMVLLFSMALAMPIIPWAEIIAVSGTGFWLNGANADEKINEFIRVSFFHVEFFVGVCMFIIVAWLLMFRAKEIKESWELHSRIRFYFCLTIVGIAVNLSIGICGTVHELSEQPSPPLIIWSWIFRYIHVALDTIVLYGVLRENNMDERGGNARTSEGLSASHPPAARGARGVSLPSGRYKTACKYGASTCSV